MLVYLDNFCGKLCFGMNFLLVRGSYLKRIKDFCVKLNVLIFENLFKYVLFCLIFIFGVRLFKMLYFKLIYCELLCVYF